MSSLKRFVLKVTSLKMGIQASGKDYIRGLGLSCQLQLLVSAGPYEAVVMALEVGCLSLPSKYCIKFPASSVGLAQAWLFAGVCRVDQSFF